MTWLNDHPRAVAALFVFDCVMIVATVCAFGMLIAWMYGQ